MSTTEVNTTLKTVDEYGNTVIHNVTTTAENVTGLDKAVTAVVSDVIEDMEISNGSDGATGADGLTPYIGDNGNWYIGDTDTGVQAAGQDGTDGTNGTNGVGYYGTCSTAAATAAKTVSISGFTLTTGAMVTVKFTYANTNASSTLNVTSTGAKQIYWNGSRIDGSFILAGNVVTMVYDGTYWQVINPRIASATVLGGIKVGDGLEVASDGTLSISNGLPTTVSGSMSNGDSYTLSGKFIVDVYVSYSTTTAVYASIGGTYLFYKSTSTTSATTAESHSVNAEATLKITGACSYTVTYYDV